MNLLKKLNLFLTFIFRHSGGESSQSRVTLIVNVPNNSRKDVNVTKNREELKRRIEETRKKLQSVRKFLKLICILLSRFSTTFFVLSMAQ